MNGNIMEGWSEREYERETENKGGVKENMNGNRKEGWSEREHERET